MDTPQTLTISSWSHGGNGPSDAQTRMAQPHQRQLTLDAHGRFYRATMAVPDDGLLVLSLISPRPVRLSLNCVAVIDQPLSWRLFQRQLHLAAAVPVRKGEVELLFDVGERPRHLAEIDEHSPSRNREWLMRETLVRFPDRLDLTMKLYPGASAAPVSLRFEQSQFQRDGITYQHVLLQNLHDQFAPPQSPWTRYGEPAHSTIVATSPILPGTAIDISDDADRTAGRRRLAIPIAEPEDMPEPLRQTGEEDRIEPSHGITRWLDLRLESAAGGVTIPMPAFECLGRLAPRREYHELQWPSEAELIAAVPVPVLPPEWAHFLPLYRAAWSMFLKLLRDPAPESGATNSYISTGSSFGLMQFVWDSSFTTIAAAYAWRRLPVHATLDNLYSRQFDGGYIHRETDWASGLPVMFEPDFSPNPPLMSVAEWQIARLSGDRLRLRKIYPALRASHEWLRRNRRLEDGTYWTTGLANGLDNSPSMGDGYPDLSAQMAHEAEILGWMAGILGDHAAVEEYRSERDELAAAVNAHLWSGSMQIYSTSLPGGGHNPNKVVTAFWPLWADIVPPDRVQALADHLTDPKSFWRHHPIPSLASDSSHYRPDGHYWLGSTWAPTNYAAIKGFDRAGRHDLAVRTTVRHLQCMSEVLQTTGEIWENYCAERSQRGSLSGSPYCWSALGPIALLIEILVGVEADAMANTIRWTLPEQDEIGVRDLAFGANTVSLVKRGGRLEISALMPFTLEIVRDEEVRTVECAAGKTVL